MKRAPEYLGQAGDQQAKGRLAEYVRYAELVRAQEAALEAEDIETFEKLSHEIHELRRGSGLADEVAHEGELPANEVADVLKDALATNRRIQERLSTMKKSGSDEIRNAGRWRHPTRRYLADRPDSLPHIDVTS